MKVFSATVRAAVAAVILSVPLAAGWPGAVAPAQAGGTPRFIDGLGDVPAMPGLAPVDGGGLVFDKPTGRIAEAVLSGPVGRAAVQAFYDETMPQLGWSRLGGDRFRREGEELRLEFVDPRPPRPGTTTVRFVVIPR